MSTRMLLAILLLVGTGSTSPAAEYFVAPDGKADATGTQESPWDLESAWSGKQPIRPGDTLYLEGGTYRHPDRTWESQGYSLALQGSEGNPIHIRPVAGKRVTIDAPVVVPNQAQYLWVWGLEITISESANWNRRIEQAGSHPQDAANQPAGGLTIYGGQGSKFINLVVHNTNSTGIGFWRGAVDAELHGCLIFQNGWIGPDRFHGPGIYTQNQTGNKWITDCILWGNHSTTIQAYGSANAYVNGFRVIGNIAFAPLAEGSRQRVLIGGGRPSEDIEVRENLLYQVPLQVGYTAEHNEDAVVRDNRVVEAGMSVNRFRQADVADNLVIAPGVARPDESAQVVLRPNKYDQDRAHLAVFNWRKQPHVEVDLSGFLRPGDRYRIQSALDFFGPAAAEGMFQSGPIELPIPANPQTGEGEFSAWVVLRTAE